MKLIHKLWRRCWGKSWLDQEMRILRAKRIPWTMVCKVRGHEWGDKSAALTVGPLDSPPRERDYYVLGFNHQCERCYVVEKVPYTVFEKLAEIEDAIRMDLLEWPTVKRVFS